MSLTYTPVEFATEYTKDHTNLCGMCHPVGWQTDNRFIYVYMIRIRVQYPVLVPPRVVVLGHTQQTHKQNYNIVGYSRQPLLVLVVVALNSILYY